MVHGLLIATRHILYTDLLFDPLGSDIPYIL